MKEIRGKKYKVGWIVWDCIAQKPATGIFEFKKTAQKWINDCFDEEMKSTFQVVKVLLEV